MLSSSEIKSYVAIATTGIRITELVKRMGVSYDALQRVIEGGGRPSTKAKISDYVRKNPVEASANMPTWLTGAERLKEGGWRGHAVNTTCGLVVVVERHQGDERVALKGEMGQGKRWIEKGREMAAAAIDAAAVSCGGKVSAAGDALASKIEELADVAPGRLVSSIKEAISGLDDQGALSIEVQAAATTILSRIAADARTINIDERKGGLALAIEDLLAEEINSIARSVDPTEILETGCGGADGALALRIDGLRRFEDALFNVNVIRKLHVRTTLAKLRDRIEEAQAVKENRETICSLVDDILCAPDAHAFDERTPAERLKRGVCRGLSISYIEGLPGITLGALMQVNHAEQLMSAGGRSDRVKALEVELDCLERLAGPDLAALLKSFTKLRSSDLSTIARKRLKNAQG